MRYGWSSRGSGSELAQPVRRFVLRDAATRHLLQSLGRLLASAEFSSSRSRRQATIDDSSSLDVALGGAHAVIYCAGPFFDTAECVVSAVAPPPPVSNTSRGDVAARAVEYTVKTRERFDEPARKIGVAVVPRWRISADLAICYDRQWMIGISQIPSMSWSALSMASLTSTRTLLRAIPNLLIERRVGRSMLLPPGNGSWKFAEPVGDQEVIELPFAEILLISRYLHVRAPHTYLTQVAVGCAQPGNARSQSG